MIKDRLLKYSYFVTSCIFHFLYTSKGKSRFDFISDLFLYIQKYSPVFVHSSGVLHTLLDKS